MTARDLTPPPALGAQPMIRAHESWYATFTNRWSAGDSAPWLAHLYDPVGWHGARMAVLARAYWGADARPELIWACIAHDLGELRGGDAPAEAKADETLRSAHDRIEDRAIHDMGMHYPLSAVDLLRLRFLDRLDAYLWVQTRAPHILSRSDWIAGRHQLVEMADELGVSL